MKRSLNYAKMNVRVGIMSVLAFVILVWVLFFPVRGGSSFSSKITVTGYYQRVDGLRKNAPIYYRGIEVGSVKSVIVVNDHPDAPIQVVVRVEKRVLHLLPKDTTMAIVALGLLGDVFVDMVPGTSSMGPIADGDVLATKPYESVLTGMNALTDDLKDTLHQLKSLLQKAQNSNSSVGRLFNEDKLYQELVAAVHEMKVVAERVSEIERTVNEKLLDKSTKESVDSAVASAQRVLKNADALTTKATNLKWYLGIGASRYVTLNPATGNPLSSAFAELTIVPSTDKFYRAGIEYFKDGSPVGPADYSSTLGGYMGYHGYLGLRVLESPIFFRGGLKRTSVAAGLDLRVQDLVSALPLELSADMYKYGQTTPQLDLGLSLGFLKVFRLTGGADDVMGTTPMWRGGVSLIYDDEDLTSILVKAKSGL